MKRCGGVLLFTHRSLCSRRFRSGGDGAVFGRRSDAQTAEYITEECRSRAGRKTQRNTLHRVTGLLAGRVADGDVVGVATYTAAMRIMLKEANNIAAWRLLEHMAEAGIAPSAETYLTLMKISCRRGATAEVQKAWRLLRKSGLMREKGVRGKRFDTELFSTLVRAKGAEGEEAAFKMAQTLMTYEKIIPNETNIKTLIDACTNATSAARTLSWGTSKGLCTHTLPLLNAVLARSQTRTEAQTAYTAITEAHTPNRTTFSSLLKGAVTTQDLPLMEYSRKHMAGLAPLDEAELCLVVSGYTGIARNAEGQDRKDVLRRCDDVSVLAELSGQAGVPLAYSMLLCALEGGDERVDRWCQTMTQKRLRVSDSMAKAIHSHYTAKKQSIPKVLVAEMGKIYETALSSPNRTGPPSWDSKVI